MEKALTGQRSVQVGKMSTISTELALPDLGDFTKTVTMSVYELLIGMVQIEMSELRRVKLGSKEDDFLLRSSLILKEPWKPVVHNNQKRRLSALDILVFWISILSRRRIQGVTGRRFGLKLGVMESRLDLPRKTCDTNSDLMSGIWVPKERCNCLKAAR